MRCPEPSKEAAMDQMSETLRIASLNWERAVSLPAKALLPSQHSSVP